MRFDPKGVNEHDEDSTVATSTSASTRMTSHTSSRINHRSILQVPSLNSDERPTDENRTMISSDHSQTSFPSSPGRSPHRGAYIPHVPMTSGRGMAHVSYRPSVATARSGSPSWSGAPPSREALRGGDWPSSTRFPAVSSTPSSYLSRTTALGKAVLDAPTEMGRLSPPLVSGTALGAQSGRGGARVPVSSRRGGTSGRGSARVIRAPSWGQSWKDASGDEPRDATARRPSFPLSTRGRRAASIVRRGSTPPNAAGTVMAATSPSVSSMVSLSPHSVHQARISSHPVRESEDDDPEEGDQGAEPPMNTLETAQTDEPSLGGLEKQRASQADQNVEEQDDRSGRDRSPTPPTNLTAAAPATALPKKVRPHTFRPLLKKRKLVVHRKEEQTANTDRVQETKPRNGSTEDSKSRLSGGSDSLSSAMTATTLLTLMSRAESEKRQRRDDSETAVGVEQKESHDRTVDGNDECRSLTSIVTAPLPSSVAPKEKESPPEGGPPVAV
jgi:hypothetical protein